MDDRTPREHDRTPDRKAPGTPRTDERLPTDRHDDDGDERTRYDRSSSAKPALTDREREERWPVG